MRVNHRPQVPAPTYGNLVVGDVVAERSERGSVAFTGVVQSIGPCTDFANVHVALRGNGKHTGAHKTFCAVREDAVERWDREIV